MMSLADQGTTAEAMPAELTRATPRKVKVNLNGDAQFSIILGFCLFFGGTTLLGWLCADDLKQFEQRAQLRSRGIVVVGTETDPTKGHEHYKFNFGGKSYSSKVALPLFPSNDVLVHPMDKIPIRILPSDPTVNHPDSWEWSVYVGLESIGLAVLFSFGGMAILIALWRERILIRDGSVAAGRVTGCYRDGSLFQVVYEFNTEYGVSVRGRSSGVDAFEAGSRIWILYLPRRPQRSDVYPLPHFDIDG